MPQAAGLGTAPRRRFTRPKYPGRGHFAPPIPSKAQVIAFELIRWRTEVPFVIEDLPPLLQGSRGEEPVCKNPKFNISCCKFRDLRDLDSTVNGDCVSIFQTTLNFRLRMRRWIVFEAPTTIHSDRGPDYYPL